MLELKKITKIYEMENFKQKALDGVSINFRKNEFASILGPSGSGKTTMLNVIGGLDHYDTGELIINETSTKKYKDRDWDTYRNHRVGFVFQSYNLITHQTVLSNVELALTLSGVSKSERRKRAKKALKDVGLEKHINKKPSQLSGGQMQRVAIARALVNDPEILLADEPTGALDSDTSEQVMDILKKVAKDKLVIMVTHNPELAEKYSNRIIKLKDGKIVDDSNPYDGKESTKLDSEKERFNTKKTSMNFLTALSLSLNNLMTKKGRTILTAFAGSIGIIGIALILSLSSGVNKYITDIQKETMLSYPIQVQAEAMDLTAFLEEGKRQSNNIENTDHDSDAIYVDSSTLELASSMTTSMYKNNLTEFKKYLDNPDSEVHKYVGDNGIIYSYDTKFKIFNYDIDGKLVNADGSTFEDKINSSSNLSDMSSYSSFVNNDIFTEIMPGKDGQIVSDAIYNEYDLVSGRYPENYNEVIIVLDEYSELSATTIYYLGLLPSTEYKDILDKLEKGEKFTFEDKKISYDDMLNAKFKLLTSSDFYKKNSNGTYDDLSNNDSKIEELVKDKSLDLNVVGVIRHKKGSNNMIIYPGVGYTKLLTDWIIEHTDKSEVVIDQENNPDTNIINGMKFNISGDDDKVSEAVKYLSNLSISDKANLITMLMGSSGNVMTGMSESQLALMMDQYLENPDRESMIDFYDNYISTGTYDKNMQLFGKVNLDTPSNISIYTDTFEAKDDIVKAIDNYNKDQSEENKITVTDYVGLLMSSVTSIINAISYVLIAFVSISLIVSSIMIAIITYISVLERTKEIGILRAIGASKKDVTRVFKAETFIEGLVAGVLGILITILLNIPINKIIKNLTDVSISSKLPWKGALILILISVILTMIAGLFPSRLASKKDPVEALRSE